MVVLNHGDTEALRNTVENNLYRASVSPWFKNRRINKQIATIA